MFLILAEAEKHFIPHLFIKIMIPGRKLPLFPFFVCDDFCVNFLELKIIARNTWKRKNKILVYLLVSPSK